MKANLLGAMIMLLACPGAYARVNSGSNGRDGAFNPTTSTVIDMADHLTRQGRSILIYDNLHRPGVEQNLNWLRSTHGNLIDFHQDDVRNTRALQAAVLHASEIYHFAAQVAVTTSLNNPVDDFEINGRGTLNLLEAVRQRSNPPPLIFTSTNKVYGDLQDLPLRHTATRHQPADPRIRQFGMSEASSLDFHSPYGCSKGAADQYVLDYARTYRLPAVVFRMSCVYGPHQFGNEDQGWVAHFLIRALHSKPITIFGDGRQVRDILFVHDLVDAFLKARHQMVRRGKSYRELFTLTEERKSRLENPNAESRDHLEMSAA